MDDDQLKLVMLYIALGGGFAFAMIWEAIERFIARRRVLRGP